VLVVPAIIRTRGPFSALWFVLLWRGGTILHGLFRRRKANMLLFLLELSVDCAYNNNNNHQNDHNFHDFDHHYNYYYHDHIYDLNNQF
jgi:hypothetical protein